MVVKMLKLLLIAVLCVTLSHADNGPRVTAKGITPLTKQMSDFINNLHTTWKAGENFEDGFPLEKFKKLLGVRPAPHLHRLPLKEHVEDDTIPGSFDAR